MFPAPVDFKFENDSYKFIGILSIIAVFGFIYTCTVQVKTLSLLINKVSIQLLDMACIQMVNVSDSRMVH